MAQRGRPKLNDVTKLQRDLTVFRSYNESRRAGEKHANAVVSAASEVSEANYPFPSHFPAIARENPLILAEFCPEGEAIKKTQVLKRLSR
jgi:hypothetical protein